MTIVAEQEVTFENITIGSNPIEDTSARWTFGDGTESSVWDPKHTYDEPGIYTVTLTVTDTEGLVCDPMVQQLTVLPAVYDSPVAGYDIDPMYLFIIAALTAALIVTES